MGFITLKTHHLLGILCILSNHRTSKSKHLGEFLLEKKWVGNCRSSFSVWFAPKRLIVAGDFWLDEYFFSGRNDGFRAQPHDVTSWSVEELPCKQEKSRPVLSVFKDINVNILGIIFEQQAPKII